MMDIYDIAEEILHREGGFVNDPDDLGGPTNFGVTLKTLKTIRGSASIEDVKNLTENEAEEIYIEYYFFKPKINKLEDALHAPVFDMQVNSGRNAIKILQRITNKFGYRLKVDGYLGPKSIGVINELYLDAKSYLVDAYGIGRRDYYFELADNNISQRKYCKTKREKKGGWIKRAEEFMHPKYHLSHDEFKKRIKKWA